MSKTDETQLEEDDSLLKNTFASDKLPGVNVDNFDEHAKIFVRGQIINWELWQELLYT